LALLGRINNVHLMSRIKEPELSSERLGNLARIWGDPRRLRRNSNKYLHKEVARWNISGIKRTNKANVVFWICSMKPKLFMKLANCCLLRRFVPLKFTARKSDLSTVATALCALNQQHLAVVRMRINAVATTGRAATS
jgi:hypothetical protein